MHSSALFAIYTYFLRLYPAHVSLQPPLQNAHNLYTRMQQSNETFRFGLVY